MSYALYNIKETPKHIRVASGKKSIFLTKLKIISKVAVKKYKYEIPVFLIFIKGTIAKKTPNPNCQILAGNIKNIISLWPLEIKYRLMINERRIIIKMINR